MRIICALLLVAGLSACSGDPQRVTVFAVHSKGPDYSVGCLLADGRQAWIMSPHKLAKHVDVCIERWEGRWVEAGECPAYGEDVEEQAQVVELPL